nr:mechanosensitive ion channel family protein [Desulfobulbaceae bacterium]
MKEELANLEGLYTVAIEFAVKYSFQILGALIVLVVGLKLASWVAALVIRLCEKHNLDVTLSKFTGSVAKMLVVVFVVIITIGQFGISVAPLVAAVSALAFGASFAIQGPVSNYGAGLSIIISRPFVVGNTISVQGVTGIVKEIKLAATVLTTEDDEQITIPNKHIVGEIIHNSFANKVVETTVGIAYHHDPNEAVYRIKSALANLEDVCQDPAPQIGIDEFGDSSINIGIRFWVPTRNYFQMRFLANGAIFTALKEGNISIPFPQREVAIISSPEKVV